MMNAKFSRLTLVAVVILAGCGKHEGDGAGPAALSPAVPVVVAPVSVQPLWDEEEVVGNVEAAQRAVLSAKVTGVIDAVKVAPGARVQHGTVLATIDAREIKARLDSAMAAQDQAQKDFARIERLLQSGSSTRQEFDAATTRLRTADASLVEARTMLQYTGITAPFDGVVTRKLVEVGDLATPGKPLLEMENSSLLRFECEIPEALLDRVNMGSELPVRVDAAGAELNGKISEIAPSASAGSRTFWSNSTCRQPRSCARANSGGCASRCGSARLCLWPKARWCGAVRLKASLSSKRAKRGCGWSNPDVR